MLLAFPNDRLFRAKWHISLDVCHLAHYSYSHGEHTRTTLSTFSRGAKPLADADNASVRRSGFRDVQGSSLG